MPGFKAPVGLMIGALALLGGHNAVAAGTLYEPSLLSLGLPASPPAPLSSPALRELGRALFFDPGLSVDGTISCATCHDPQKAYSDGKRLATGTSSLAGTRNAISLLNVGYQTSLFWDGRRRNLEAQATDPFFNPREHGLSAPDQLLQRIRAVPQYVAGFAGVLGVTSPTELKVEDVAAALAAFERSLVAGDSPFDRFYYAGKRDALLSSAQRGMALFTGRAQCAVCHTIGSDGAAFTDRQFHTAGIGTQRIESRLAALALKAASADQSELDRLIVADPDIAALGRFVVTRRPADIGSYKTPSLRNVAITAPYMHDGSVPTLQEAIDRELYYRSARAGRPIVLTDAEKVDLLAFLQSLTSPTWPLKDEGAPAPRSAVQARAGTTDESAAQPRPSGQVTRTASP